MGLAKYWTGSRWSDAVPFTTTFPVDLVAESTLDQTSALNAAIAAVPDGESPENPNYIMLPHDPAGYRIDGTLSISDRHNLVIGAVAGEQFLMWTDLTGHQTGDVSGNGDSNRDHVVVTAASTYVTVRNIKVRGPNDAREIADSRFADYVDALAFEHAFAVQNACLHITVENCEFENVYGDGIYVGGTGTINEDITIRNILGTYCGRQAMGIVLVDGGLFEDIDIQWGGRSGLDVEPNHDTHFVKNCTFRRLTMGNRFHPFIFGGNAGDIGIIHVSDIVLEDSFGKNSASSHTCVDATPNDGHNLTVRNVTDLRQRSVHCIRLRAWSGTILIEDNNISSGRSTPTSYGVFIDGCTADITIRNNNFNGPSFEEVGVGGADELYIVNSGTPASLATCGNTWNMGSENDGVCA